MSDEEETRIVRHPRSTSGDKDSTSNVRSIRRGEAETHSDNDDVPTRRMSGYSKDADMQDEAAVASELTVGWLVVIEGPGKGCSREVYYGMNGIGRGEGERVPIDFGDEAISREAHIFVVYDDQENTFFVQHGGKSNLVRLNGELLLDAMQLTARDIIEIGKTKLKFIPLCDKNFSWETTAS